MDGEKLSSLTQLIDDTIGLLNKSSSQEIVEDILKKQFKTAPNAILPDSHSYYHTLNYYLYKYILKHYKEEEEHICCWRFFKKLSSDQLNCDFESNSNLKMLDSLIRFYFYSGPLDDLTCIFIPINERPLIRRYLQWIKAYFYDVNYPTSLLWLYALDSSMSDFFPDEIIFLGRRLETGSDNIFLPDFSYEDTVLLKRFSSRNDHFIKLKGVKANYEFEQIFGFLKSEYRDRCLSHSGKQEDFSDKLEYNREWEKFGDVLEFGVSDNIESGGISFSDLRSSTNFLNTYGKNVFRDKIQQPFFEQTKVISRNFNGRIDKFMGDNVMCVFLQRNTTEEGRDREIDTVLNNFMALFSLCKILLELLKEGHYQDSELGLRSGVCYGNEILRSNLGNEIVRDFTVTGETVNLAARLEHFSVHELMVHNENYFSKVIERFPQINALLAASGQNYNTLNPETKLIVHNYTLYQNIISNLEKLEEVRFDIRFNQAFYKIFKRHMSNKGYPMLNPKTSKLYGYEEYDIEGFNFKFFFSYYKPKGFNRFEKIWLLPLSSNTLLKLDIEKIK